MLINILDDIRYKLIKEVGDGTFGSVWRAINKLSGEVVSMPWVLFILNCKKMFLLIC